MLWKRTRKRDRYEQLKEGKENKSAENPKPFGGMQKEKRCRRQFFCVSLFHSFLFSMLQIHVKNVVETTNFCYYLTSAAIAVLARRQSFSVGPISTPDIKSPSYTVAETTFLSGPKKSWGQPGVRGNGSLKNSAPSS